MLNLPSINRGSRELADYSLFSLKKSSIQLKKTIEAQAKMLFSHKMEVYLAYGELILLRIL